MDDHELLRDYVERHSERAFSDLVERHLPFVYGTALRLVRDAAAAEDVAQGVFIALARKAWTVRPGTLPGWLYRATQRAAYMAIRTENRRRQRETAAMNLAEQNRDATANWETLAPLLDDALKQLNRVEQDALLLRYFDGRSMSETGRLLSLSEPATQMRVSRALEKMRAYFARQGVTASAALLATTLGTNAATPPPVGLAGKITPWALAGAAAQADGAGALYVSLRFLYMSAKTKPALTVVTVTAVIVFAATSIWWYSHTTPTPVKIAYAPADSKSTVDPKSPSLHPPPSEPMVPPLPKTPQSPPTSNPLIATALPDPNIGSKAELKTAFYDMARLYKAGDTAGFLRTYKQPDKLDPEYLQRVQENQDAEQKIEQNDAKINPVLQNIRDQYSVAYSSLAEQTPIFNAAGDEATYQFELTGLTFAPDHTEPLTMIKINGKWYIKQEPTPVGSGTLTFGPRN